MTELRQGRAISRRPIMLFGGTSEGRELAEFLRAEQIPTKVFVTSTYAAELLPEARVEEDFELRVGRLDRAEMQTVIEELRPRLIIDATHPYASLVSANLKSAAETLNYEYLRLNRASMKDSRNSDLAEGCAEGPELIEFNDLDEMLAWLETEPGRIFSALGAKACQDLAKLSDLERLTVRILPLADSLEKAVGAGIPSRNIICMQGPFSIELNLALFRASGAKILLTKESGKSGGYLEKLEAARRCEMKVALLKRPLDFKGLTLAELKARILEVKDGQED